MKLIDEYNRTETLKMLEKIIYADTETKGYKTEISFGDIYDALSQNKKKCPALSLDFWTYFPLCLSQYMNEADNYRKAFDDYCSCMAGSIAYGDYIHYVFSDETMNERIIINIDSQENTIRLSRALLSLLLQMSPDKCPVVSFKFFLKSASSDTEKKDKIVIYYKQEHRDIVYGNIINAAKLCGMKSCSFLPDISAFYHLAGDDNGNFPVGVAVEITSTGMSFTGNCSNEILYLLTGQKIPIGTSEDMKEQKFEIKKDLHITAEEVFDHVIKTCCKTF